MSVQSVSSRPTSPRLPKVVCGLTILALIGVLMAVSGGPIGGRKIVLGKKWPIADLVSIDRIDHRDWDHLLQRYVDEEGSVGYADWKEKTGDVETLDAYLKTLSRANPELDAGRDARLAFWINAYNALTIRGILREYPKMSIQDHAAQLSGFNLWRDLLLHVGERDYSLGQIEHEVLRPIREPRIHFAIVCASRGCPRLLNRAYQSTALEQQLHENSRNFFSDPQKLHYDPATGRLRLSPILKWYARDFGESQAEVLENIIPYLPDRVSRQLPGNGRLSADFLDYDWSLNDQAPSISAAPVHPGAAPAGNDEPPQESR